MPPLDDSLYIADFSIQAIRGVLRTQKLKVPETTISFQTPFYFTTKALHQWNAVFNLPPEITDVPFAYYWKAVEKYFLDMINRLGINYKNILHLSHERSFPDPERKLEVGRVYHVSGAIKDICVLDRNRLVLISESLVKDPEGHTVCVGFDYIFVRNVSAKSIHEITNHPDYNNHSVDAFTNLKKREAHLRDEPQSQRLFFSEDIGLRYGMVSGDLNPIHINRPLARLFGYKQPFAQGTCVANYLLKLFTHDLREPIRDLRMTFSRPVLLGQSVTVRYNKKQFELFDRDHLLAFGERTLHEI